MKFECNFWEFFDEFIVCKVISLVTHALELRIVTKNKIFNLKKSDNLLSIIKIQKFASLQIMLLLQRKIRYFLLFRSFCLSLKNYCNFQKLLQRRNYSTPTVKIIQPHFFRDCSSSSKLYYLISNTLFLILCSSGKH